MDPNNCALSALVCDGDQNKTITNFVEQKGIVSSFVYEGIRSTDPWIRLMEGTKLPFPSGMGDTLRRDILSINSPNEMDALDWRPVRSNYPGNSACCNEFREMSYGSRTVHGCLTKIGYQSPILCKDDIVFKTQFLDQLMQIVMTMRNISSQVWGQWLRHSYAKSVTNVILSGKFGHPEAYGAYPVSAFPTSKITVEHLDTLSQRVRSAGGLIGSPIEGLQTIVIGIPEYNRMVTRRMEQNANLVGARGENLSLPNYQEWTVADLGKVITWGGYAFILVDTPRRYRARQPGETWEDAIVPSTIQVRNDRGTKTEKNPDYYNPRIALYSETIVLNKEAAQWLIPPTAMVKSISAGGKEFFPATDYSGEFTLVNCPLDPLRKTSMFMAEFMGGMMSMFPEKGRAILHLATHINACDDDDDVCVSGSPSLVTGNPIRQVSTNANAGQLQVLVEGALPEGCPPGYSLFIESEKGQQYLIGSIVSTWVFNGNAEIPQAGNYYVIQLATGLNAAAVARDVNGCDPWKRIACLPTQTVSSSTQVTPCGVCRNGPPEEDTCLLTAIIRTDRIRGVKKADGSNTIATTDYTTANALQTALQTWLTANGGGTATVTFTGSAGVPAYEWTVQVSGAAAMDGGSLVGGSIVYDDGIVNTTLAPFGQSGVCETT